MYLKELRINGFKSFANPTRLDLQRGVTAIVGPNGCGKSNIADAIRWVLGEQSAKSLRAGAMQDVIFQGTDSRKPVNLCEVSLVFTDCEEQLGTAFAEVEVTRRVMRDGGGQYYINGKQCRLRDIQRLFLDTGVGQVSYSFMLQGQIDQILSSNPAERRTIFEEAAGISRYKAQRREALAKLGHVDVNLARVTDVIEEISRQIGSLKRQAAKALRFKRIKFRLTHLDLALSANRLSGLREALDESERKAGVLRTESERLKQRLESEEGGLAGKRERRNAQSAAFQEAQQQVFETRSQKENAEAQAEFAEVRLADNQRRLEEIENELERLAARQEELTERAAGESRSKQEQLSLFDGSDDVFKRKSEELAVIQTRLTEAETQLSRDKQALLIKESAVTRFRSNCTTLEVDLKSYQVRHANLADEIKALEDEAEVLAHDLEQIERTFEVRQEQRETEEGRVDERRQHVAALTNEFRELQGGIAEQDRRLAAVVAQINMLEGLQAKLEGFSEGAKAVLQGKLEGIIDPSGCEVLLKNVSVDSTYGPMLETLLGASAEGVVIKDRRRLTAIAEALREKKLGRAYLKFAAPARAASTGSAQLPPAIVPALSVVSATSAELQPLLENLLRGSYFAESLADFLAWWSEHPDFEFDYVATAEGELVDRRGWVLGGTQKKGADRSFLSRANEIRKFSQERRELEGSLEERRERAAALQEKIEKAERAVEDQRRRVMEIAQEVTTLETQGRNARKNVEQNTRSLEQKRKDLERQDAQKAESTRRLENARQQLSESEAGIEAQKQAISEGEERVAGIREQREELRETFNDARLEIAQKKQRLELLERGLQELQAQTREVETQRAGRLREREQLRAQNGDLQAGREQQRRAAGEFEAQLRKAMEGLERARTALKAVEEEIEVVEKGLSAQRETYDKVSRELNVVDVALARQQAQVQHLGEEIRREYEVDLKTIDWRRELWTAGDSLPERMRIEFDEDSLDEPEPEERPEPTAEDLAGLEPDWEAIEEELRQLRQRLQAIGAVNLVAIEEYKELNERYSFLKAQSDDLWASKDELLKAIDEINTTSKELFSNTFDQIRKNFIYTFDALFGGGHADLMLVDAEDVLESGIDITAQPPGTRLKTLALLSGGQKTMTAVALLFAVYMVKPSPFCVLDELDAPLDDANIGRFCKMLERFLEYSQFLIITHNKRTISVADTIYGVTMQEKGVSRLLSMRFDKESGNPEEVVASA